MRGVSAAGRRRQALRRSSRRRYNGGGLRALTACIATTLLVFGAVQFWHCGTEPCGAHLSSDVSWVARTLAGGRAASPSRPHLPTGSPMLQSQQSDFLVGLPTTRDGYESMTLQDLRDRAIEVGSSAAAVTEARNADDAKRAMYNLIVSTQRERTQAAEATARAAADAAASSYTEDLPLIPVVAASPPSPSPLSPPSPPP